MITNKVITRGMKAGGDNTNKHGLPYEKLTELSTNYIVKKEEKYYKIIVFNNNEKEYIFTKQAKLFKYLKNNMDNSIQHAHGCKNPDECFIDYENKYIFIIEKKFQQVRGSVCEKIQTYDFKLWQYERLFPTYKIIYIYCLSDWFKHNCKAEIEYLIDFKKAPIFWGNDADYKSKLIDFIINY